MILAWTGLELSRGQATDWHRPTNTRTHTQTHRRRQWQYPKAKTKNALCPTSTKHHAMPKFIRSPRKSTWQRPVPLWVTWFDKINYTIHYSRQMRNPLLMNYSLFNFDNNLYSKMILTWLSYHLNFTPSQIAIRFITLLTWLIVYLFNNEVMCRVFYLLTKRTGNANGNRKYFVLIIFLPVIKSSEWYHILRSSVGNSAQYAGFTGWCKVGHAMN